MFEFRKLKPSSGFMFGVSLQIELLYLDYTTSDPHIFTHKNRWSRFLKYLNSSAAGCVQSGKRLFTDIIPANEPSPFVSCVFLSEE